MTITELKKKYNVRIINMAVSEIVLMGLRECLENKGDLSTPLTADVDHCIEDINESTWSDIRSIIKRSL